MAALRKLQVLEEMWVSPFIDSRERGEIYTMFSDEYPIADALREIASAYQVQV